jgi:hypothetical protein
MLHLRARGFAPLTLISNRGKNPGTLKSLTVLSNSRRVVRSLASCRKYRYRQATDPETKARIGSEYCLS